MKYHITIQLTLVCFIRSVLGYGGECSPLKCTNEYLSQHVCDIDGDPGYFRNNATHVSIGLTSTLSGPFYLNSIIKWFYAEMGFLCGLDYLVDHMKLNRTIQPAFVNLYGSREGSLLAGLCMNHAGISAVVGPPLDNSVYVMGIAASLYKTNLVGTLTSNPEFSNKDANTGFPYFSRVYPSDSFQAVAIAEIVKSLGIRKVATFHLSSSPSAEAFVKQFVETITTSGLDLVEAKSFTSSDNVEEIQKLLLEVKRSGARIIIYSAGFIEEVNKLVLSAALNVNMMNEEFMWFGATGLSNVIQNDFPADKEIQLSTGVITIEPTIDYHSAEFEYLRNCITSHNDDTEGKYANVTFVPICTENETCWTDSYIAHTFDATIAIGLALESLSDTDVDDREKLRQAIRDTKFPGATGFVSMDSIGDRTGSKFKVNNIIDGIVVPVGIFDTNTNKMTYSKSITFPGNKTTPPVDYYLQCDPDVDYDVTVTDCTPRRIISYTPKPGDATFYCSSIPSFEVACDYPTMEQNYSVVVLSVLVTTTTVVVMCLVWRFRQHKVIRVSQMPFLLLCCAGALPAQIMPIMLLGEISDTKCALFPILASLSFMLVYGPLFLKSYRVSIIHNNKKLKLIVLRDLALFKHFLKIFMVLVGLLIAFIQFDQPHVVEKTKSIQNYNVAFRSCTVSSPIVSALIYFYLGGMMVFGCYISFSIRNVSGDLSEAKYIFVAMYNTATWICVMLLVIYFADASTQFLYMIQSIALLVMSLSTVLLIVVPKLNAIRRGVRLNSSETRHASGNKGVVVVKSSTSHYSHKSLNVVPS